MSFIVQKLNYINFNLKLLKNAGLILKNDLGILSRTKSTICLGCQLYNLNSPTRRILLSRALIPSSLQNNNFNFIHSSKLGNSENARLGRAATVIVNIQEFKRRREERKLRRQNEWLAKKSSRIGPLKFGTKLRENIYTVPNALCIMRIGMAPVVAYLICNNQYEPAIGVFAVAGVTDLLDGWIARVVPGQSSVMGSFLDPMADKILVGTLFISLTYMDLIPVPLTVLILGRDAILIMAGFYIRYQSLEPPKTLSRYFNVAHPTAQLAPTLISKVNTGIQLGLVGATLISTIVSYDLHPFLQFLWYGTAATTVISAVGYVFAKDTVKFLKKKATKSR